jgi:hypothetical protein
MGREKSLFSKPLLFFSRLCGYFAMVSVVYAVTSKETVVYAAASYKT